MKTTLELPSDLMKAIKLRAVDEHRTMTDLITELLQQGMAGAPSEQRTIRNRVKLPLVMVAPVAHAEDEITPERAAEILLQEEAEHYGIPVR